MSDDEDYSSRRRRDEDEEEEVQEEEVPKTPKLKPVERQTDEEAPKEAQMTEAQLALEAARRKHDEEDSQRLKELEEARRLQREKEEEDLKKLKEKQERRKKEREEEERRLDEQKRISEDQRRREEEEKRKKVEEEKLKKQEETERKKAVAQAAMIGGRNFVIPQKADNKTEKFGNVIQAKGEMSLTKEQLEDQKKKVLSERTRDLRVDGMNASNLKSKAQELWQLIISLETQKYDLETRHSRQEYDLKELNERQRQINRNKYLKKGLDPDKPEASTDRYPPKVQVASKYERRVDRRSFDDRKAVFDKLDEEDKGPPERPTIKLRDETSWQTAIKKHRKLDEEHAEEDHVPEAAIEADEEE